MRATRPVVLITDPRYEDARIEAVVRAVASELGAGRLVVQLRDKAASPPELARRARWLRDVTRAAGAWFVVNGSVDVAVEVRADGAHCPNRTDVPTARATLGPEAFVSVPAHDDDEVHAAIALGATAVLVSPIHASPGKGAPRGEDALRRARAIVDAAPACARPLVYALGGVTVDRAAGCVRAGADGVAFVRELLDHAAEHDPAPLRAAVARLRDVLAPPTDR